MKQDRDPKDTAKWAGLACYLPHLLEQHKWIERHRDDMMFVGYC